MGYKIGSSHHHAHRSSCAICHYCLKILGSDWLEAMILRGNTLTLTMKSKNVTAQWEEEGIYVPPRGLTGASHNVYMHRDWYKWAILTMLTHQRQDC